MNRFTKDMATIDDMLPLVLFDLIQVFNQHIGCTTISKTLLYRMFLPPPQTPGHAILKPIKLPGDLERYHKVSAWTVN